MEVIGVSGGPDSMALLDKERRAGKEIVVCHVNYHRRSTAGRDEKIVESYCRRYGIPFRLLSPQGGQGNFQAWARQVRYDFFIRTARDAGAGRILTAHQQDDVLETYLMQRERGMLCEEYGIKGQVVMDGILVVRPLLGFSKRQLEDYCVANGIPFGVDESNLADDYRRNYVRHHLVPAGEAERMALLEQLAKDNESLRARFGRADAALKEYRSGDGRLRADFLSDADAWLVLDRFLFPLLKEHLRMAYLQDLCRQLASGCLIDLRGVWLERFGNEVLAVKKREVGEAVFSSVEQMLAWNDGEFGFAAVGPRISLVGLSGEDFPVRLRQALPGDSILMRFGTKKLSRFFVDRKIPRALRSSWPVLTNKNGDVIFVFGLGCRASHFHAKGNVYMIKLIS